MRINVYDEEITGEVLPAFATAATGLSFHGVRLMLASPDVLHNDPDDDDRSAITLWWEAGNDTEKAKVRATVLAMLDTIGPSVEG